MNLPSAPHRTIRSFVRRAGRITSAQRRALDELWPRYGIKAGEAPLDFAALFPNRTPPIVEIGFGNGEALATLAAAHPENNYLGIEVHRPGIGSLLLRLDSGALTNVRLLEGDAKEVLAQRIPPGSVQAVHVFFPDPWPKKRHHKRRLVQADFVASIQRALAPDGYLHLATDWQEYAEHMLALLDQTPGFENTAGAGNYAPRPEYRPLTKFERRGQRLGHGVWDLIFRRTG
ncbi:MAG: tRNA (guanosine(46)-N7)-methyltransferase TrmB [Gammaproteobacteria bacterium]|nr:tRNA (guanosine(46)-N7)-methyltransferase TrmB [Gammaproteobacteria bacterium]